MALMKTYSRVLEDFQVYCFVDEVRGAAYRQSLQVLAVHDLEERLGINCAH